MSISTPADIFGPTIVTDDLDALTEADALYCHYDRQINAQPAYLQLTAAGRVDAGYNPEIGDAMPADVWHGCTLRWTIPNTLTPAGVRQLVTELMPLLERVHAGHTDEWSGSNWVGQLTDDAQEANEAIDNICRDLDPEDYDHLNVWDAIDWLSNDTEATLGIRAATTDDELTTIAARLVADADPNTIIQGLDRYLTTLRDDCIAETEEIPA